MAAKVNAQVVQKYHVGKCPKYFKTVMAEMFVQELTGRLTDDYIHELEIQSNMPYPTITF